MATRPVNEIEAHIGLKLPEEIKELYSRSNGERFSWDDGDLPECGDRPMRLLSSSEVVHAFDLLAEVRGLFGACPFWIGVNFEYACVFLEGPLKGRIHFFDDDSLPDSVAFRSVASFRESLEFAVKQGLENYYEMQPDYFFECDYLTNFDNPLKAASDRDVADDLRAWNELREEFRATDSLYEEDEQFYAKNIMGITPESQTGEILEFLEYENIYIQERAIDIIGYRKFEPAVSTLGKIARGEYSKALCSSAIRALGSIATNSALSELISAIPSAGDRNPGRIYRSLEKCGCQVRKEHESSNPQDPRPYYYQQPGGSEWIKVSQ